VAVLFFESSALVKRYASETGSSWVLSITDPRAGHRIYVAAITGAEIVATIARKAKGTPSFALVAPGLISQFRNDFARQYLEVSVNSAVIARAMALAQTYALRGYDAVQLAAALELNAQRLYAGLSPVILVSADAEINVAAPVEGLTVEDPNAHP
jgi:predicted nucleic acid-binding protein